MATYFGNHVILGTMPSNTSVPETGPRVYIGMGDDRMILTADEADRLAMLLAGKAATARVENASALAAEEAEGISA